MCTGLRVCVALLAVVAMVTTTGGSPQSRKCPFHQFFDTGTNDCESCQEICDNMNLTRTEEMCKKECPDYIRSMECQADQYYDDVVHSCAHCSLLCDNHIVKKTTDQCFNNCRDYFQRDQILNPANREVGKRTLPTNPEEKGGETLQLSSNSGTLVAIITVSSAAVIVVIVVGIAVWFWKRHPRRPDNRQPEVRYAAATQEDGDGTSDERGQRSQIALMSGEAYPEDFGPSYHSVCEDSGADCRSSVPSSVVTS